jgi:DNA-binding SARP family transcriptional activator
VHVSESTAVGAASTTTRQRAQRAALDLYQGELAAGHQRPWLTPARTALRRDIIDVYLTMARETSADKAIPLLDQAMTIDPYNEHIHRRAVDLLEAAGDYAAVQILANTFYDRIAAAGLRPHVDRRSTGRP